MYAHKIYNANVFMVKSRLRETVRHHQHISEKAFANLHAKMLSQHCLLWLHKDDKLFIFRPLV